jgi:hypothetical protein
MEEFDPIRVAPNNYTVVFENARVRVLAFHGPPKAKWGSPRPSRRSRGFFGTNTLYAMPSLGPSQPCGKRRLGMWSPAKKHTGENIGSTDMDCILVELKEQR